MNLGIDIGSVSIGVVLMNDGEVIRKDYANHESDIFGALSGILKDYPLPEVKKIGITGRGQNSISDSFRKIDSIICFVEAAKHFSPAIRNIFFIGGESFGLIELNEKGQYKRHSSNTSCASGTGAFLDQQAKRMNVSMEQLADLAALYEGPIPEIATRCAVFAKSDIIHFQQKGFTVESICCGLCQGLARSILDTLLSGRTIEGDTIIIGGVSKNVQVTRSLEEKLHQKMIIPNDSELAGAYGAALMAEENPMGASLLPDVLFNKNVEGRGSLRPPLAIRHSQYPDFEFEDFYLEEDTEVTLYEPLDNKKEYELILGMDIGSTSTKATLVLPDKKICLSFYNKTAGNPIGATQRIFRCIRSFAAKNGVDIKIKSVGTTGSGRKLIREILSADFEVNEITAHAKAAVFIDRQVDTIIEIGGQDSKFTQIKDGAVYHASMNYVCAAGTGSFIEEQAKKLDIKIDDYADLALGVEAPFTSDRCTVYMERDLNTLLSKGWNKRQLLAAVLYSVRDNYINKVVNRAVIGDHVYFQGATARNKALVAAFEELLNKPIHISSYCHLTGAWGVALLMLEQDIKESKFVGLNFSDISITTSTEICQFCNNRCKLSLFQGPEKTVAYGTMCGRDYEETKPRKKIIPYFDAVKEYRAIFKNAAPKESFQGPKIGLPVCLFMFEYQSLWEAFFRLLGCEVVPSRSSREILNQGQARLTAEFCAPITISHGHIQYLLDQQVDYIFFPGMVREKDTSNRDQLKLNCEKTTDCYYCYYTEYLPKVFKSVAEFNIDNKMLSPLMCFDESLDSVSQRLYQSLKGKIDITEKDVKDAFSKAYDQFLKAKAEIKRFGKEELVKIQSQKKKAVTIALLGRPYNALDPVVNIDIPKKIMEMGYPVFLQEMLPVSTELLSRKNPFLSKMHWNYGQQILKATEYILKNDHIFPVYLTNFRCSPDSFILEYFKEMMDRQGKPYLILQLDAQGSDTGYMTRIEAGLESFKNWKPDAKVFKAASLPSKVKGLRKNATILIPHIDDLVYAWIADTFNAYGYRAILMEENEETVQLGFRYANGGQCLPLIAILGGVISSVKKYSLDPSQTILYLPTCCSGCNFSQYPVLAETVFHKLGWHGFTVFNPNIFALMPNTSRRMNSTIWKCHVIGGLLRKLETKTKPFEVNEGETDRVKQEAIQLVKLSIRNKHSLKEAFKEIVKMFQSILTKYVHKPRVALIGDLYVKYNPAINQDVNRIVEDLGGELLVTSTTEYAMQARALDKRILEKQKKHFFKKFKLDYEYKHVLASVKKFENIARPLLGGEDEPSMEEIFDILKRYGIEDEMSGETSLNFGRVIHFIEKGLVDAVIHVNPIFCCPGVVTASLLERVQKEYNVPIINIFYDGTGDQNKVLVPHFHYLKAKQ